MVLAIIIQKRLLSARFCPIIIYLMVVATPGHGVPLEGKRMSGSVWCPGQVLSAAYRYRTVDARSALECASLCQPDDQCLAVLFEVDQGLCHFGNATSDFVCSTMEPAVGNVKYYEMPVQELVCQNGGNISFDRTFCTCPDGYYGITCDITYADCVEYENAGILNGSRTILWIKPPLAAAPFSVMCIPQTNAIKMFVTKRHDYSADFNRTWQEYRDGFGRPDSRTYWMGLEKLHLITASASGSRSYELYVRVNLTDGSDSFYQQYLDFVVHGEDTGYAFSYGSAPPGWILGDCLSDLQEAKFSTYDVDNDDSATVHCAEQHGGGWWFQGSSCSPCNPFGPILSPFDGIRKGVTGESFWTTLGNTIPYKIAIFLFYAREV